MIRFCWQDRMMLQFDARNGLVREKGLFKMKKLLSRSMFVSIILASAIACCSPPDLQFRAPMAGQDSYGARSLSPCMLEGAFSCGNEDYTATMALTRYGTKQAIKIVGVSTDGDFLGETEEQIIDCERIPLPKDVQCGFPSDALIGSRARILSREGSRGFTMTLVAPHFIRFDVDIEKNDAIVTRVLPRPLGPNEGVILAEIGMPRHLIESIR